MSYNIDHINTLKCALTISANAARKLILKHESGVPEGNILEDLRDALTLPDRQEDDPITLRHLSWYGEWSGNSMDLLKEEILPKFIGVGEFILTWEGGDCVSGLRVVDGVVTEPEVTQTLAPDEVTT